jgi:hypothetical protein
MRARLPSPFSLRQATARQWPKRRVVKGSNLKRQSALSAAFILALSAPAQAAPGDMSVAAFLAKVDGLMAKGPLALFSSDIGVLKSEATAAGVAYHNRLTAERAQGKPSSCPPRGARPSQGAWLRHLRAYPAALRPQTDMHQAMVDYYQRNWPCRTG